MTQVNRPALRNYWWTIHLRQNRSTLAPAREKQMTNRSERCEYHADFVRRLVDVANRNEEAMDGTMEPVRCIVAEGDLVFAVWQDPEEEYGVCGLTIKGAKLLKEIAAGQTSQAIRISAVKCTCEEQAIALKQVLGDRDHDA
jgi:hypothetical protein